MKWIHIAAGLISIIAGFTALYAAKGGAMHRRSGLVFVIAMLVMTSTAVVAATFLSPNRGNVVAGLLTFYLVSTGLLTVRSKVEQSRRLLTGLMLLALLVGIYGCSLGWEAVHSANGTVDRIPAPPLFLFGIVGILAAALDARLLMAGHIEGARRIARHLWRMSFALWIATTSLFLGQAKFFPEPLRKSGLLAIPVLLVLLTMFYWLWRTLRARRASGANPRFKAGSPPAPAKPHGA